VQGSHATHHLSAEYTILGRRDCVVPGLSDRSGHWRRLAALFGGGRYRHGIDEDAPQFLHFRGDCASAPRPSRALDSRAAVESGGEHERRLTVVFPFVDIGAGIRSRRTVNASDAAAAIRAVVPLLLASLPLAARPSTMHTTTGALPPRRHKQRSAESMRVVALGLAAAFSSMPAISTCRVTAHASAVRPSPWAPSRRLGWR